VRLNEQNNPNANKKIGENGDFGRLILGLVNDGIE
jgi:hypothetical protein